MLKKIGIALASALLCVSSYAAIVGALPNTIVNGQTIDATPIMANYNWIVNQVNANAAALATTPQLNTANSFTQPQSGVSATAVANFPIVQDIQNGAYVTVGTIAGTNTITGTTVGVAPSALAANQYVYFIPANTNTGATTFQRDGLAAKNVFQGGAALTGGELKQGVPTVMVYDGTQYNMVGPLNGGTVPNNTTFSAITLTGTHTGAGGYLGSVLFSVPTQTVTMTIASPCVVTAAAVKDTPETGSPIVFTTSGSLPTGIVSGTTYWVVKKGTDGAGKFRVAATKGGADINTSGSQSGTHTANNPSYAKATGFNGVPSIIRVTVVGGGGGGGGSAATGAGQDSLGGGGGGGGASIITIAASSLAASETVTVGAGGTSTSGASGGTGGTSSFGSWASATGGVGGTTAAAGANVSSNGAAGGVGASGDINMPGFPSTTSQGIPASNMSFGSVGGGSYLGGGAAFATVNGPGAAATGFGGGGGATLIGASQSAVAGGTGYHGAVVVEEYQ